LARLQAGDSIALVSDAGTPLVSDPGRHLVRAAREAGLKVVAVPGPSAILAALAAAGLEADEFVFAGFPPRRSKDLTLWLQQRFSPPHPTLVFFEAPHRIRRTLVEAEQLLGNKPIILARELTKVHEELVVRSISDHLRALEHPRGEFTVIVPAETPAVTSAEAPGEDEIRREVGQLTENRAVSLREAARRVGRRHGLPANEVYRVIRHKTD
jgi:16S rRNA (cytidine1402-2'-O)-methyltransferase